MNSKYSLAFEKELRTAHQNYKMRCRKKQELMQELENKNVKFKKDEIINIVKTSDNGIFFLERGNKKAGYKHILDHAESFKRIGISVYRLPYVIFTALQEHHQVDVQNPKHAHGGRPIYEVNSKDGGHCQVAISTGNNGFIVGANPTHRK